MVTAIIGGVLAALISAGTASAQAVWNSATDGNWGNATMWSTGTVPGASNNATASLTNTDGSYVVTYDTPINTVLGSLAVSNSAGNTTTLNVNANNFRTTSGTVSHAAIVIGSGGAMTSNGALASNAASALTISGGSYSGGTGIFGNSIAASTISVSMSSGSFALNGASNNNYGAFNMTGGNVTVTGGMYDTPFTSTISGGTYTSSTSNYFSIRSGTVTVSGNATFNVNQFRIDGQGQQLRVTGGAVNVTGAQFFFGINTFTGTRNSTGNQTGGTVSMAHANGLVLGQQSAAGLDAASLNLYQLSGGTLNLQRITLAETNYLGPGTNRFAMSGGTLNLGSGGLVIGAGSGTKQFQFSGGTVGAQTADWSSSAPLALVSGTTTFRASDSDGIARNITLSGALSGNGSLAKTGDGVLTLSGANTYIGTTTVNAGTLLVNGTHTGAGDYTVATGATLGGTGSISGNLSIAGDATFWVADLDDPTGLDVAGGTVSFTNAGGGFGINRLANIDWNTIELGTYTLISGNVSFANVDTSPTEVRAGVFASLQSGSMQLVVVPEPGTLALGVVGIAGLCSFAKRKRKR